MHNNGCRPIAGSRPFCCHALGGNRACSPAVRTVALSHWRVAAVPRRFLKCSAYVSFAGSCTDVECGAGKACVMRSGSPKCICSPNCKRHDGLRVKGPVCGTDGVSYKSHCRLKKRSCRTRDQSLTVAYHGLCQSKFVVDSVPETVPDDTFAIRNASWILILIYLYCTGRCELGPRYAIKKVRCKHRPIFGIALRFRLPPTFIHLTLQYEQLLNV